MPSRSAAPLQPPRDPSPFFTPPRPATAQVVVFEEQLFSVIASPDALANFRLWFEQAVRDAVADDRLFATITKARRRGAQTPAGFHKTTKQNPPAARRRWRRSPPARRWWWRAC